MRLKTVFVILSFTFLCSCGSNLGLNETDPKFKIRLEWAKDYAFCECTTSALGEDFSKNIKRIDHSKSTLVDIANLWSFTEEIDNYVQEFVDNIPQSQIEDFAEKKPYLFECLKFRRSKALEDILVELLKN